MRRLCCWLAIKWSCVSAAPEHCGSIGCGGWTSCCFTTSHEVTMHQIHSWKRISTASIRAHLLQAPATGGSLEDNLPRTKLGDIFLVDEYSRKEALDIPGCLHLQCALVQCTELNCSIFNLAHSRQVYCLSRQVYWSQNTIVLLENHQKLIRVVQQVVCHLILLSVFYRDRSLKEGSWESAF